MRQIAAQVDMGRVSRHAEFLFKECQVEEAAVIREELNPEPAEHGFEVGRREFKLAGARHASARRSEAVKIVGGSGDRFASDPHTAGAGKSTEISNDCVRFRGDTSHAATRSASRAAASNGQGATSRHR
jgi:hypothetical protein